MESTKILTDYYQMTKRGSINQIISRIKSSSQEKQTNYLASSTPSSRKGSIKSIKIQTPASNITNNSSKKRDSKQTAKNTPFTPVKITPKFQQPFMIQNLGTIRTRLNSGKLQTPLVNPQIQTQDKNQQGKVLQQNSLFRNSSMIFDQGIKCTTQRSGEYQMKPTNYTVSTDVTQRNHLSQDTTTTNKRQANQREDQYATTFSVIGEKRSIRQATQLSVPPISHGMKGVKGHCQSQSSLLQAAESTYKRAFKTPERVFLEDQRSGQLKVFKQVRDEDLFPGIYNNTQFSLINLNFYHKQRECDYETDIDSLQKAKEILRKDLMDALDFFVKKDPLITVESQYMTMHTEEQEVSSHHTHTLKSLDVKDINDLKSRQKGNLISDQWTVKSGTDSNSNYLFTSVERVDDYTKVEQKRSKKSNFKTFDMSKLTKAQQITKNQSSSQKQKLVASPQKQKNLSTIIGNEIQNSRSKHTSMIKSSRTDKHMRTGSNQTDEVKTGTINRSSERTFSPQSRESSIVKDLEYIIKNGYRSKKDVLWDSVATKNNHMATKPFQTGLRNTSNLMTKIVKHITLDMTSANSSQRSSFARDSSNGSRSYRDQLGYQKRQGSQLPNLPSNARTLDVAQPKIALTIPKSRGLRDLKAEIMKSSNVFKGSERAEVSRLQLRSQENSMVSRESLLSPKASLGQAIYTHFTQLNDKDVDQQFGKPKTSTHVNSRRLKMFYTTQIQL
ncbi:UNKNOWN [Stylonychia lemnae]|uniref:Uncharacterized protein n=1 Tax=Stylonychia lemnae TaxID=5949 RepID=A0A078ABN1_STYLE|nr:UNKNOWN [Stylonychia lemnae]|eukprot:CDW79705.1 UNKNOWN [Stylonychia lemnae]